MAKKARFEMSAQEMTGPMTAFRPEDLDHCDADGHPVGALCTPMQPSLFATDVTARPLFADEARAHSDAIAARAQEGQRVYRVLDLFAGAGGGVTGAKRAIEGQGHLVDHKAVNHSSFACASLLAANPDALVARWPVDGVTPTAVAPSRRLDLLAAGPSCCPFSSNANGIELDPVERALCWSIIPFLRLLQVDHFLIENVPGFAKLGPLYPADHPDPKRRNRPVPEFAGQEYEAFLAALRVGYHVEVRVQDAADFGVPQNRKRLIIMGARHGLPLRWPKPTHGDADAVHARGVRPWRTAEEVIDWSDRGEPITAKRGISQDYTMRIVERALADGRTRFIVPRKQGSGERANKYYRGVDRPFMTITASAPNHAVCQVIDGVVYHRALREDELLAAQSFERDRKLVAPSRDERLRLVGNAMPPAMIEAHVNALLFGANALPSTVLALQDREASAGRRAA